MILETFPRYSPESLQDHLGVSFAGRGVLLKGLE